MSLISCRIEQLERTVGALLERLGEDSSSIMTPAIERSNNLRDILHESAANPATKSDYPSAPPVMVIRDLASDIGVRSPDASSHESVLDGLISADLSLNLITMYATGTPYAAVNLTDKAS